MIDSKIIAETTNRVDDLFHKAMAATGPLVKHERMLEALHTSCTSLKRMADDPFLDAFEDTTDVAGRNCIDVIVANIEAYNAFLQTEEKLLVASGLKPSIAKWVVTNIRENIERYRDDPASRDDLAHAIDGLQFFICGRADSLSKAPEWRILATGLLSFLAGATTVTVNIVFNGQLGAVAAGVSCTVGGGMVKDGAKLISDLLGGMQRTL